MPLGAGIIGLIVLAVIIYIVVIKPQNDAASAPKYVAPAPPVQQLPPTQTTAQSASQTPQSTAPNQNMNELGSAPVNSAPQPGASPMNSGFPNSASMDPTPNYTSAGSTTHDTVSSAEPTPPPTNIWANIPPPTPPTPTTPTTPQPPPPVVVASAVQPTPPPADVVAAAQPWSGSSTAYDGDRMTLSCQGGPPNVTRVVYGGADVTQYAKQAPSGNKISLVVLPSVFRGMYADGPFLGNMGPTDPQPGVQKTATVSWGCGSMAGTASTEHGMSFEAVNQPSTSQPPTPTPPTAPTPTPNWSGVATGDDGDMLSLQCSGGSPFISSAIYGGQNATSYLQSNVSGNPMRVIALPSGLQAQYPGDPALYTGNLYPSDPNPGVAKTASVTGGCTAGQGVWSKIKASALSVVGGAPTPPASNWQGNASGPDGMSIALTCQSGAAPQIVSSTYGGADTTSYLQQNIWRVGNQAVVVTLPGTMSGLYPIGWKKGNISSYDPAPGIAKTGVVNWSCTGGGGTSQNVAAMQFADNTQASQPAYQSQCANPEQDYLNRYPDVAQNVASGAGFACGYHHWVSGGWAEGRVSCWPRPQPGASAACGSSPYILTAPATA